MSAYSSTKRSLTIASALTLSLAIGLQTLGQGPATEPVLTVFASDTVSRILPVIGVAFRRNTGVKVKFKFAPAAKLAADAEQKTPFDVLITDDAALMSALAERGVLDKSSFTGVAALPLVLAADPENLPKVEMRKGFDLSRAVKGKILLVSPEAGTEGAAAKQALEHLGWLDALKPRLGTVPDGRSAVKLLDTGAAGAAILWASDITFSETLAKVAEFPPETYTSAILTAALTAKAPPSARKFLAFLLEPMSQGYLKNAGLAALPAAKK